MSRSQRALPLVTSLCGIILAAGNQMVSAWAAGAGVDHHAAQKPSSLRIDPTAERPRPTSLRIDPTIGARASALRIVPTEVSQRRGIQQVGEATARTERQFVAAPPKRQPTLTERADALAAKGKYQEAALLYQRAVQTNPKATDALTGWGHALLELGDETAARDKLLAALELNPRDAATQVNLGVAYYRAGDIARAVQAYQSALDLSPKLVSAHFNLAMAQAHQGQLEAAAASYRTATTLQPQFREAHNNLGLIYETLGDIPAAEQAFRAALGKDKDGYALAHYNLGRLYEKQADYDRAIQELQIAVRQQPVFPEAYLNLGNVRLVRSQLKETKELDAAISAFRQAIAQRQGLYPLAYENLAIALTFKGDKNAALAAYRMAFEQGEASSADTFENLLTTLSDETQFLIGNELSRSDNPGNLRSAAVPATKSSSDRLVELLEQYAELPDSLKDHPDVRYCAGRAYITIGQAEAARAELRRSLELSSGQDETAKVWLRALEDEMRTQP
ncbi:MAG: tetratricopeptide repeat protein [Chloracidobacterium sp.]|uniref:Tetratricopeptide repeat protein n=1 Tax=Chloracidobacterium validum TaxID=2821543 RepID=A0ABX8B8A5_9BACT|nr:tetratricopeptide repeat protein [Chloracidobacterium validum]QUW01919.1 tetratricopeptide repeat protein [Chloracidobacterium validum]